MRSRKTREVRAVIYISGTDDEMKLQFDWCHRLCSRRRYNVVGVCRETGDSVAWVDAQILKRSGIADRIVVYSNDIIPTEGIESVTDDLPIPGAATPKRAATRRPRPIR